MVWVFNHWYECSFLSGFGDEEENWEILGNWILVKDNIMQNKHIYQKSYAYSFKHGARYIIEYWWTEWLPHSFVLSVLHRQHGFSPQKCIVAEEGSRVKTIRDGSFFVQWDITGFMHSPLPTIIDDYNPVLPTQLNYPNPTPISYSQPKNSLHLFGFCILSKRKWRTRSRRPTSKAPSAR